MKEWLIVAIGETVVLIEALSYAVIVLATIEAALALSRSLFEPVSALARRRIGLRYARWLVFGLTFQLAAGVLELSVTSTWDAVERLAGLALIRALLAPFQERGALEVLERLRELWRQAATVFKNAREIAGS